MDTIPTIIGHYKPGVVLLAFFANGDQVGSGSGFLTNQKLVSNSHVIRGGAFDAVELSFGDQDTNPMPPVRLSRDDFYGRIADESTEGSADYVVIDMSSEPEFAGRPNFELAASDGLAQVGDPVLFLGFPLNASHLSAHSGRISADYRTNAVHRLQIDGSINRGNSGGPLIHVATEKTIGIITRMEPGLYENFRDLQEAIGNNVEALSRSKASMTIGGVDPIQATRVTMSILGVIAQNLERSANVGIGWAFCVEHLIAGGAVE